MTHFLSLCSKLHADVADTLNHFIVDERVIKQLAKVKKKEDGER